MQDVPVTSTRIKIPCRGGQRRGGNKWNVMRITPHWKQRATSHVQSKKDPCLLNGVCSPITYSCRKLFILAKASAWMERMALSPRFLQNTTKGNVSKRDAVALTGSLYLSNDSRSRWFGSSSLRPYALAGHTLILNKHCRTTVNQQKIWE